MTFKNIRKTFAETMFYKKTHGLFTNVETIEEEGGWGGLGRQTHRVLREWGEGQGIEGEFRKIFVI